MKFAALVALAGMLLWGCNERAIVATPVAKSYYVGDTLEIAMGDTLFGHSEFLWLSLDILVSDSRCPVDVVCIWAGNARTRYTLYKEGTTHHFALDTHPAFNPDTIVANLRFSLIDLTPHPHSDSLFSPSDFRSRLIVAKQTQ